MVGSGASFSKVVGKVFLVWFTKLLTSKLVILVDLLRMNRLGGTGGWWIEFSSFKGVPAVL